MIVVVVVVSIVMVDRVVVSYILTLSLSLSFPQPQPLPYKRVSNGSARPPTLHRQHLRVRGMFPSCLVLSYFVCGCGCDLRLVCGFV